VYDHGGNHLNNTVEFALDGQHYRYAHSSIGFGGRSCQPMDCLQVLEADGTTLVEVGCAVDQTHPVASVRVRAAGRPRARHRNCTPVSMKYVSASGAGATAVKDLMASGASSRVPSGAVKRRETGRGKGPTPCGTTQVP